MCSSKEIACLLLLLVNVNGSLVDQLQKNKYIIESKGNFTDALLQDLRKLGVSLKYEITPSVCIFEDQENRGKKHVLHLLTTIFTDQIQAIEPSRVYRNTINPVNTAQDGSTHNLDTTNLVCSHYYGMGVEKVWERNITGKGVTIAINDVGIDTDLVDLEPNIKKELCKNFFTDTKDVSPDHFPELVQKMFINTNHGNQVASVTSAVKGNNHCSAGIAPESNIIGHKVVSIEIVNDTDFNILPSHLTRSAVLSRALKHATDVVDISVIALVLKNPFDQLDLATRNAIMSGATKGRQGLGVIYTVPPGPSGNELSNNIHTITVNGLSRNGGLPDRVVLDSSVLVSGLTDGNNLTSSSMVTTSYKNICVKFSGLSAAVAQVSGIIALGLQANPKLTLRDVQHLLVQSAEHKNLTETIAFRSNGDLNHFHNILGFGLPNADKFVSLAQRHRPVPPLLSRTLDIPKRSTIGYHTQIFEFCYMCNPEVDQSCLIFLEHVTATINFTTYANQMRTELISPMKTHSVVMDLKENERPVNHAGNLVSVHFWGEVAFGKWEVKVQNKHAAVLTMVHNLTLTLRGTRFDRKRTFDTSHRISCDSDSTDDSSGKDGEQRKDVPFEKRRHLQEQEGRNWSSGDVALFLIAAIILIVAAMFLYIFCKRNSPISTNTNIFNYFGSPTQ